MKKKLDYRQYDDADEFAAEIRSIGREISFFQSKLTFQICINPLEESLAEDSLAILYAFEELVRKQ